MRNQFYSDKKDLVKWGSLLHLARSHDLNLILQVAYLRPDHPRSAVTLLVSQSGEKKPIPLPKIVWTHFRNIKNIQRLQQPTGLRIELLGEFFEDRAAYTESILRRIRRRREKKLVFLDPDTGIEPGTPGPEHVTADEISRIFAVMKSRDVLVLYQHARRTKTWLDDTSTDFAEAVAVDPRSIVTLRSPQVSDVAFFAATKPTRKGSSHATL